MQVWVESCLNKQSETEKKASLAFDLFSSVHYKITNYVSSMRCVLWDKSVCVLKEVSVHQLFLLKYVFAPMCLFWYVALLLTFNMV